MEEIDEEFHYTILKSIKVTPQSNIENIKSLEFVSITKNI